MKRVLSLVLTLCLLACALPLSASAASSEATAAANELYQLGLFAGTGNDASGNPNFALDRIPTRAEGVAMLVRLLGKEKEAQAGTWATPFTDVPNWAKPYVGYAYTNKLTYGSGDTTFGSGDTITAPQYLSFVLRALGYQDGTDFTWRNAAALSDSIGLTQGQYSNASSFTRGDIAVISRDALSQTVTDEEGLTLRQHLGIPGSLEEFIASDEMQEALQAMEYDTFDIKVIGDGNKLIYNLTFWDISDLDKNSLKAALAEALEEEELTSTFSDIASSLKTSLGIPDPVVVVRYLAPNGEELASREYHAA